MGRSILAVPKGSVLGRSCDLLLLIIDTNIANYVNDSILYAPKHPKKNRTESLTSLKIWFKNKYLKANSVHNGWWTKY